MVWYTRATRGLHYLQCLIVEDGESEELLRAKLIAAGIDPVLVNSVVDEMADLSFWSDPRASAHLRAIVDDWFQNSWSSLEGTPQVLLHKS